MKEERSLTYAKQNFKRNMNKYSNGDNFENCVLTYYLRNDEIIKLYEYTKTLLTEQEYTRLNYTFERLLENN